MVIAGWIVVVLILIGMAWLGGSMVGRLPNRARATAIQEALWNRRGIANLTDRNDPKHGDQMVGYLERVVDRQINKARGILPFNSIIIALLAIERARIPYSFGDPEPLHALILTGLYLAMMGLAASSLLCLFLFLVHWGEPTDYASFTAEVEGTVQVVRRRSRVIEWAVLLSIGSLLLSAGVVGVAELSRVDAPAAGSPHSSNAGGGNAGGMNPAGAAPSGGNPPVAAPGKDVAPTRSK